MKNAAITSTRAVFKLVLSVKISFSATTKNCLLSSDVRTTILGAGGNSLVINHRSSLLSLKYVDICSGILVPDVMHDVLEGVLQYEMKLLLQHLIFEKSYFRVRTLEKLIESYELGFMEVSNRPTPIDSNILRSKDNSLKQNGKIII